MTLDKLIAQLTALSDKGCGAKMDVGVTNGEDH